MPRVGETEEAGGLLRRSTLAWKGATTLLGLRFEVEVETKFPQTEHDVGNSSLCIHCMGQIGHEIGPPQADLKSNQQFFLFGKCETSITNNPQKLKKLTRVRRVYVRQKSSLRIQHHQIV